MLPTAPPSPPTAEPTALPAMSQFTQHTSTGSADIDSKCSQKAIDLLTDFQECHSTQKPDKNIAGHRFIAGCRNGTFYLRFLQGQCRRAAHKQQHQDSNSCCPSSLAHCYLLFSEGERIGNKASDHGYKQAKTPCIHYQKKQLAAEHSPPCAEDIGSTL